MMLFVVFCKWYVYMYMYISKILNYTVYTVLTRSCPFSVMSLYSVVIPPSV